MQKHTLVFAASLLLLFLFPSLAQEELPADQNPLKPLKLDSPRDTMRSFMDAMNDYREGVEKNDPLGKKRVHDAVRCFELDDGKFGIGDASDVLAAIYLKEVIDRVIVLDYSKVPGAQEEGVEAPPIRWRLRNTEINILQVAEGRQRGKYLFSRETVAGARGFYDKIEEFPYLQGSGMGAGYRKPWTPANLPGGLQHTFVLLPNWQWLGIFVAILAGLIVKVLVQYLLRGIRALTTKTRTQWDQAIAEAVARPGGLLAASVFWFYPIEIIGFEGQAELILVISVKVVLAISIIWLTYGLVGVFTDYLRTLADKTDSMLDDQLVPLVKKALRIFVVIMGMLVMFQNLGIEVMSVLAGLGLGGLAFALAAKDTCANLFGSVMILLDRPFHIGDWVVIGSTEGSVESIGFRSTRIRTFYNSVISVPNAALANANIDNMGRREYRRIKAFFGLVYSTPPAKLEAFIAGVKKIIEDHPNTRKDYYHVVFNSYGDFSLNIMLYCFLKVPDWTVELKDKEQLYLSILRLAEDIGVEFAFPTETLHVESLPSAEEGISGE
ncbi:MAG: MscS family membrane protein [Rhodothermales bacterium]|jgi:MscS family membrane protein